MKFKSKIRKHRLHTRTTQIVHLESPEKPIAIKTETRSYEDIIKMILLNMKWAEQCQSKGVVIPCKILKIEPIIKFFEGKEVTIMENPTNISVEFRTADIEDW